jgi:hypothetical protein
MGITSWRTRAAANSPTGVRRWMTGRLGVALLGIASFALVGASAAPASVGPSGASASVTGTSVDQATVDFDYTRNGPQLEINSAVITQKLADGSTVQTALAVANIQDIECTPTGCQNSNVADCFPAGNDQYDQTLPQGALQFGPGVGDATLEATFTCYPGPNYPGPTYPLTVDLTWSGQVIAAGGGPAAIPQPPVTLIGGAHLILVHASITGTASDGTTEFIQPGTSGEIVHQDSTTATP